MSSMHDRSGSRPIVPGRLPVAQRAAIMQQRLRDLTFHGYRVEVADGPRAIVYTGDPINHVVHAILTVFTCGLWLPVWILIMMFGGIRRRRIHIDDYGNLVGVTLPSDPQG